jgi:hypothetical protein
VEDGGTGELRLGEREKKKRDILIFWNTNDDLWGAD